MRLTDSNETARPLVAEFDHLEWDDRSLGQVASEIRVERPIWLRTANFFTRTTELLRLLGSPRLVLWKLEFWGTETAFDKVPMSPGIDPERYTEELLSLGHQIVPYTFNSWNRDHLMVEIPALRGRPPAVLPIAQKLPVASRNRGEVRTRFGIGREGFVIGVGGLLHPAKGIDELVGKFVRDWSAPETHLLCSLVVEDEQATVSSIRRRWIDDFGDKGMERVHIHVGPYGQWRWMCGFYRAIDLMLVNSVSDSWGRMVSEALGFGVPTIVRRADCATNYVAPDLVFVDDFGDVDAIALWHAARAARKRALGLASYVAEHYAVDVVRERWLALLRKETPAHQLSDFDRALAEPDSRRILDQLVVY